MSRHCLRFAAASVALFVLFTAAPRSFAAAPPGLKWDLVTVGPGSHLFSLWGHSALCVSTESFERGTCFDFGVAIESDPARLAIGTLQGKKLFATVRLPTGALLASSQLRDTWRQSLPIEQAPGRRLLAELEMAARESRRYAYQPLFRNCTTELRDRLDRALGGRLRQGDRARSGEPLRRAAEAGISGQVIPLVLLELAGGSALDRPATAWESMALPAGLMQAVDARLAAAPSRLFSSVGAPPPTSPAAGRIILLLLTAIGSVAYWFVVNRRPSARPSCEVVLVVWLVALGAVPLVGALSTLPSLEENWLLLALTPLDALLLFRRIPERWKRRYALLRLTVLVMLGVASVTGLVAQPLLVGLLVAGAPLGVWLAAERARRLKIAESPAS